MTAAAHAALDQIDPTSPIASARLYAAYQRAQTKATDLKALVARFGGSAALKADAAEAQQTARELYAAYRLTR